MLLKQHLNANIKKYKTGKRNIIELRITRLKDLTEKVIPLFIKHQIRGLKNKDFEDFCLVVEMMNNKLHLTPRGLAKIKKIKAGMNRGRKVHI